MKRFGLFFLVLVFSLSFMLQVPDANAAGYFPPNTSASGYVSNLALLYCGYYSGRTTYEGKEIGTYDTNTLLPYVAHYNSNNVMDDTMFDSFLFLGTNTPTGKSFGRDLASKASTKTEWDWFINRLFTTGQQLDALNQATAQASSTLGLSNYKTKVYIMLPFPNENVTSFGDVDGDGISEDLSIVSNRYKVCKWYMDTIRSRWAQAGYSNLDLKGFYWMQEDLDTSIPGEGQTINSCGSYLHTLGLKLAWIPWSGAYAKDNWQNYQFDFCIIQPNYYFDNTRSVSSTASEARTYYQGIEMEFDERVMYNKDQYDRFYEYLFCGDIFEYITGAIKGWYQDVYGIYDLYKNKDNNGVQGIYNGRKIYDGIYNFLNGACPYPGNLAYNKSAYSSSNQSSSYTANYAVDNIYSTRWGSNFSDPQWIYVDLGQAYNINKVTINWEYAYGTSYKIQVSNDAANWVDVFSTTTGDGGLDTINFTTQSARYVRMYGTQRAPVAGYSIYEFKIYDEAGGVAPTWNLAFKKTATSSSNQAPSFTPDKAVDGFTPTRWSSQYSDPQWLSVDLGQTYSSINRVKLSWESAYAKGYKIQVSANGTTWTDVYTTTTGDGGLDDVTFAPVSARYVRMYGTQRATTFGYSLYELQVYNKPDIALNKTATSSSNETSSFTPDKAFDGNSTTRWSSLYTVPQWICVDLGQPRSINNVKLNWENAYGKSYKIQVSNDATNWVDVYSTTAGDGRIDDISFSTVDARYVRMYGTQGGLSGYGFSLYDFEVYGN